MQYLCGSYTRLSKDDVKGSDESSSIQSQKMIINSFAKFNNLSIIKEYVDDGYSGGNFERPGFELMLHDIEKGKINCIITKDLSRLGREMYKTGRYIEEYFSERKIRYIAINDGFDSNIGDSMLGIRLSVNDLYLRDVSKKVKTAFRAKQESGKYLGSLPLYGYKKNPEDKHQLIVDEDVREIVEFIYDLALAGDSPKKIADTLTIKKVPIPIIHKKDPRAKNVTDNDGFGIWKRQTVKGILTNQMYIGNMVQNTFNKISYNSKISRKTKPDEYIIVENTHEGIIEKDKFEKVQVILEEKKGKIIKHKQENYLLSSLLFCKDCGRTLRVEEQKRKKGNKHFTQCNLYTRKGKFGICSSHRIDYDLLEEDIIEYLQEICEEFCADYNINEIEDDSNEILLQTKRKQKEKIKSLEKELEKNTTILETLYLDKIKNLIKEEFFVTMSKKYDSDNLKIKEKIEQLNKTINEESEEKLNYCKKSILQYMTLKNPSRIDISRLINKIEVSKDKKVYVTLNFKFLNKSVSR